MRVAKFASKVAYPRALPIRPVRFTITGTTKDSTSAPLGNCVTHLLRTSDDKILEQSTSDANGVYLVTAAGAGTDNYLVAYKPGSPDVAGTTVNTIVGTDG